MPRVFISHKHQEKQIAKELKKHLNSCFIHTWLDEDGLEGGQNLSSKILQSLNEYPIFICLLSERYLTSDYCKMEFAYASDLKIKGRAKIIPVILGERPKLLELAKRSGLHEIARTLEFDTCITYDIYDPSKNLKQISEAIVSGDSIWFEPIRVETIDGVEIQIIEIQTIPNVPSEVLLTWDYDLESFMANSLKDEDLPIKFGLPVGLFNFKINWLTATVAIYFKNRRDLFIYGQHIGYICAHYLKPNETRYKGKVLTY